MERDVALQARLNESQGKATGTFQDYRRSIDVMTVSGTEKRRGSC